VLQLVIFALEFAQDQAQAGVCRGVRLVERLAALAVAPLRSARAVAVVEAEPRSSAAVVATRTM